MKNLVKTRKIVICKSDKDGKTIVTNYKDYNALISRELEGYRKLDWDTKTMEKEMVKIKSEGEQLAKEIYMEEELDEELFYQATGMKKSKSGNIQKKPGSCAKYFENFELSYVYPLLKTHKLTPQAVEACAMEEIPVRLVQAAGNTFMSRITAMLEEILHPISKKYCSTGINEYCKDSKSYMEILGKWKEKNKNKNEKHHITAADVKALYPSVKRELVEKSLDDAIRQCSQFSVKARDRLIKLNMLCLSNSYIQHQDNFFLQNKGIVTGDNNSVSLANIALHYIMKEVKEIDDHTEIFQRYIDDIIYITKTREDAQLVRRMLEKKFKEYDLELTFREMCTEEKGCGVEFLDVLHVASEEEKGGFYTTNFVKPTAVNQRFLHGKSFHPKHVFQAIISGEAKRMKRLNERKEGYEKSIEKLEKKCLQSEFEKELVEKSIQKVKVWKEEQPGEDVKSMRKKDKIMWTTQFKNLLRLDRKEKKLAPNAAVGYCRPPTLGAHLLKYKNISRGQMEAKNKKNGGSRKCGRCGLCGGRKGFKNMVWETDRVELQKGGTIQLRKELDCGDYGIYGAQCKCCGEFYVGQTKNAFSRRWNSHRLVWRKMMKRRAEEGLGKEEERRELVNDKRGDEQALFKHYEKKHGNILNRKNEISEAYRVVFLEKPGYGELDIKENYWIGRTGATINVAKTIAPKYR